MADNTKEYTLKINGIKESVKDTQSLNDALGKNSKQYKSTTDAMNDYYDLQKKVNDSQKDSTKEQKTGTQSLKEMRATIKELLGQMAGLEQGSAEWKALGKQIGAIQDRINDARAAAKRFESDTKALDDVINLAKSGTAAFQLYKGAMSAFGMETEETEKAMQKLVGAMSVIQSLQQLQNTLKGCNATSDLLNKTLKVLGLGFMTTKTNAAAAATATTALSTAEKGAEVATKGLSTATKVLRTMLASIGIGILLIAVTSLIEHWDELVGWFTKTFPVLKKLGGWFDKVRGAISGVIDAVWATIKSFGSLGDMFKALFSGDFDKAAEIAKKNFDNVVNAFKTGYADKMADIEEDRTAKAAEESNKRTKQELAELKIQERNNKTYSKKYIDLKKKDFEEERKMARGNKEKLDEIKLKEMEFFAEVEDKKTAAAKEGAKAREKAEKDAIKKTEEERKRYYEAERDYQRTVINSYIVGQRLEERYQQLRTDAYDSGPIEKYITELNKLFAIQSKIYRAERDIKELDIAKSLTESVKTLNENSKAWVDNYSNLYKIEKQRLIDEEQKTEKEAEDLAVKFISNTDNLWVNFLKSLPSVDTLKSLGLDDTELKLVESALLKVKDLYTETIDKANEQTVTKHKQTLTVLRNELSDYSDDFQRAYNKLIEHVKDSGLEKVERNSIFGTVQTKKTLENLELLKTQWDKTYIALDGILYKEEQRWKDYLLELETLYGKDSSAYKKALKEKEDALNHMYNVMLEVGKRANNPLSTEIDYTGDNNPEGSTKPKRKLWYGNGDKKQDGSEYSLIENLSNLFQSLDEMVLAPAMDTFAMYMDFAIEETQQKLEQVEELHDKALDKVNDSADKIKELNDSLKDSSNTNLEATKQQLADEQLLYAQRLAEEKRLAEEEKALKNKAAQQEANARKMELRYQMVMAVANTAQGVSKTLAEWPYPISAIFAALQGALGAVQVGLIAKQIGAVQPVKYADGGLISGPSHSQGGVPVGNTGIEVEGQEYIVNKRSTAKYLPLLEAINAEGSRKSFANTDKKIRKYANGGTLNFERVDDDLRTNQNTNRLINAIDSINLQPVVSVKDIWSVEDRLVKVRSLAGKTEH